MKEVWTHVAQELLGVSYNTIRTMIRNGVLKARKAQKHNSLVWRIDYNSLSRVYLTKNLAELLEDYPDLQEQFLNNIKNDILTPKLKELWNH